MITIQELLFNRGLDKTARIKLVRHKDPSCDLYEDYKTNPEKFLAYQSSQAKPIFHGLDYIVSFIGETDGTLSRFIGVYQVLNEQENSEYSTDNPYGGKKYSYEIQEISGFEDLKDRIIIKWTNPISYIQWVKNEMEVIEIHPGLHYKQFTDYFDYILNFDELKEIVTNQYKDWKRMLSVTKGIYLISDTTTGKLYVGSAYGENGIWGRWSDYVKTNGHGNNKTLKDLIEKDPAHGNHFHFSILMLLPSTITPDEAIKKERLFKNKLGTNSFGLNNN